MAGEGGALPWQRAKGKRQRRGAFRIRSNAGMVRYALPSMSPPIYAVSMIKVASYNIRKALGTDRRRNPERIIDVLNELDADVIALQEADRRFGQRNAVLPPRLLEAHSAYRAVPLAVGAASMGWHGNAILVRGDAKVLAHDLVHLPCLEPRGAVSATVAVRGLALRLFGMHLDLSGLWRRRQAAALLAAVFGFNPAARAASFDSCQASIKPSIPPATNCETPLSNALCPMSRRSHSKS